MSGVVSVRFVPTGGASACARKLAETYGDGSGGRVAGASSGANGEGTVIRTFGSALSCGSGVGAGAARGIIRSSRASARKSTTAAAVT